MTLVLGMISCFFIGLLTGFFNVFNVFNVFGLFRLVGLLRGCRLRHNYNDF